MPGTVAAVPGFDLQPSAKRVALQTNYITNFDFLNQYLPDTYEAEFERFGNRTVASFLRMVSAELPSNSDLIKWTEQGRLHTKYVDCTVSGAAGDGATTITVPAGQLSAGVVNGSIAIRKGQTVLVYEEGGPGINKGIVTDVDYVARTFDVAYYEAGGQTFADTATVSVFVYGSEFKKGTNGMEESVEADSIILENSPVIIKDKYAVNGSDMAQIGWVEIATEDGASGFLWFLKSKHETRLRYEDYLEMKMIEAVPAEGALAGGAAALGYKGSEGLFHAIEVRGNIWSGGNPDDIGDWDDILKRLDKQGSIEENALFLDRGFALDIDNMLAAQNSYGVGGTSYGLFNNSADMALNLGFVGFRRGSYDFYKSDWKYLNDPTVRGGIEESRINGVLVPAGTTTVYDNVLGKNAKRPFLHVRYRASEAENRRYKTWITGSAGGASNSDLDAMEVHFLSERALCTLGANNFFLFKD